MQARMLLVILALSLAMLGAPLGGSFLRLA